MKSNIICPHCKKEKEHHAKGYCFNCYRKLMWKSKKIICKRCGREMPHHCHGLCGGCYNTLFHLEKTKAQNYKKNYNLDIVTYRKLTKKCVICNFDKIIDLHHLDENRTNNSVDNLVGLCPNHHKMLHDFRFRKEIRDLLKQKGFNLSKDPKIDFALNKS